MYQSYLNTSIPFKSQNYFSFLIRFTFIFNFKNSFFMVHFLLLKNMFWKCINMMKQYCFRRFCMQNRVFTVCELVYIYMRKWTLLYPLTSKNWIYSTLCYCTLIFLHAQFRYKPQEIISTQKVCFKHLNNNR